MRAWICITCKIWKKIAKNNLFILILIRISMKFVNRETELSLLRKEWERGKGFVIVYGRRRIGKTELIKQFVKDKPHIFFIFPEASRKVQIDEFKRVISNVLHDDSIRSVEDDWLYVFDHLADRIPDGYCIVLDEFTYGVRSEKKIVSDLQRVYDLKMKDRGVLLIISGSLLGMVHDAVLTGPLYGRRTRDILLGELDYISAKEMLNLPVEEFVKFYLVLGGIPQYLQVASNYNNFREFLKIEFTSKGYFYNEMYTLLTQELKELDRYFSILNAIAFGETRPTNIANFVGIPTKEIYPYLENLIRLGYIVRETPVPGGGKNGIYIVRENFTCAWFNLIYKHRTQIELGEEFELTDNELNNYFGKRFEFLARKFLVRKKAGSFTNMGRWWYRDKEIDIVAVNEDTNEIWFFEVEWGRSSRTRSERMIRELRRKAEEVQWRNERRREHYGIIAREIEEKDVLRSSGVLAYDLEDFFRDFTPKN